jgi:hypothetical protein
MPMPTADLSVVVPNYNHAPYLRRCLGALLSQTVLPREILVLDDASTDNSVEVIEEMASRSSLIRLVRNERNLGCCATVNLGAQLAHGEYLFLGAADDFVLPRFVEQLVGLLERHPRAPLACAFPSAILERSGWLRLDPVLWSTTPAYLTPEEFTRRVGQRSPTGHTTVWRREVFLRVGGFLPELEWLSDWFAALTAGFRHGICYVPESLSLFTIRTDSYSAVGQRDPQRVVRVLGAVLDRLLSDEFRDVAGAFARSAVMTVCGPELARVAAQRPDGEDRLVRSLVAGQLHRSHGPIRLFLRKVRGRAPWLRPRTWLALLAARRARRAILCKSGTDERGDVRLIPAKEGSLRRATGRP